MPTAGTANLGRFMRENASEATAHKVHKVGRRPATYCYAISDICTSVDYNFFSSRDLLTISFRNWNASSLDSSSEINLETNSLRSIAHPAS